MSLLARDNLERLAEFLPESVANEHCVVAISFSGGTLELAHPSANWDDENKKIIELIINRKITWKPYSTAKIEKAIRIAYGCIRPVKNCSWKFNYQCPKNWKALEETENDTVRNCSKCRKPVHLCFTESEVVEHAKLGNCVCLVNLVSGETIGDVRILTEAEIAELDPESLWPTCAKCGGPTQTRYGKQCFHCGYTWP